MEEESASFRGWGAVWGCSSDALVVYRRALGGLLALELVLRFRFLHPFYSDEGTLPRHLLLDTVDDLYPWVCLHCHLGSVWQQQVILSIQVALALLFAAGIRPVWTALLSWYLYLSLTLRNTWMNYILDRYFHYLLLHAIFLPTTGGGGGGAKNKQQTTKNNGDKNDNNCWAIVSPATVSLKLLVVWIYVDAGGGKLLDPLGGWTYDAHPLPALDTYTRHTTVARYVYALLQPEGLRLLTPVVVWIELLAAPVALLASYLGSRTLVYLAIVHICLLHVGIAACMNNAALLSFAACVPWCAFLPIGWTKSGNSSSNKAAGAPHPANKTVTPVPNIIAALCLGSMMLGSVWMDAWSASCDQSVKHIWSTLLHNRWNVFVGAEEYVTWEIAPGLLQDGSVVDIWARSESVSWTLPGAGAPCTATARPGRWRSFPYLAELQGAEGEALWGYLCKEWNRENPSPERQLIRYKFFMLQADVLPNMTFSATRKRLIHSQECFLPTTSREKGGTGTETVLIDDMNPSDETNVRQQGHEL